MAYKFKPNKSVAKRFKVTKTGKLKRHHSFTSHLMSARPANKRRKLRRSAILFEGHARNMRQLMGISHFKPATVEHERALAEKAKGSEGAGEATRSGRATPGASTAKRSAAKAPAAEANPTKKTSSRATRSSK